MSFHLNDGEEEEIAEINTTPLIDVMLVLLVMLIITIPLQTHAVNLTLPNAPPSEAKPPPSVAIDVDGADLIRWNGERVANEAELTARMQAAAASPEAPDLRLSAAADASYATVASIMAAAQRNGLKKVGLVGG